MPRRDPSRLRAASIAIATALLIAACGGAGPGSRSSATPAATAPEKTPATPGQVTYGIGDSPGAYASCDPGAISCCDAQTVTCNPATTRGYFTQALFRRLTVPASSHRVSDVRIFVDYDAVMEWNGSTGQPACVYSRTLDSSWTDAAGRMHAAGESLRDLLASVIEARDQGLVPVVAIAGYASPHAMPTWDQPAPDPTTIGGYWEYRCGVQGILGALGRLPVWAQPHVWEAMNEPDGFTIYRSLDGRQATSCTPRATAQPDGAAKAACDEAIASEEIHGFAGHAQDTVIAGALVHPSVNYLATYVDALKRAMPGASFPSTWSVHDYGDVTGSYGGPTAGALAQFDQQLAADTRGRAQDLWITEAGTVLTDRHPGADCPAIGVDARGTLGACVNGQPARQAQTAAAFFALPDVGTAVPITHLFWYQYESAPNWDSGLVDARGQPRAGYCAFFGSGSCNGNPNAS